MKGLKYIYCRLIRFRKRLFLILFLMSIPLLFGVLQPILLGSLIDKLSVFKIRESIYLVLGILGVGLLNSLFSALYKRKLFLTLNTIQFIKKNEIIENIMDLNVNQFKTISKGALINKIENDCKVFAGSLADLVKFIADLIGFLVILVILFSLNIYLAFCVLTICPVIVASFYFYGNLTRKIDKESKEQLDKYLNKLNEILDKFYLIKLFSGESNIKDNYKGELEKYQNSLFKKNNLNIKSGIVVEILNLISQVSILLGGIYFIDKGEFTIGHLVAFSTYSSNFNYTLLRFSQFNLVVQETVNSIKRVEYVHKFTPNKVQKMTDDLQITYSVNDEILKMDSIIYKFPESENLVLDKVSESFKPSKLVRILGSNGSGKSTLLHVMAGLFDEYQGELSYRGIDVKSIPYFLYRQRVCLVPQEHELLSGSIKENFLLAKPSASLEEIRSVCSIVGINDFVDSLEDSYDTIIGINGVEMSTGQKQKISLARALLVDADVYLFDEVTAALDTKNKAIAFDLMFYLKEKRNKTIVLISHDEIPEGLVDYTINLHA
ncbi:hypothetical protein B9G55_12810 [Saccharibacillus sp. O16]|nr:hypothetical protein B9G55_12810 [Saccharibacillus sp. O16]